MTKCKIRKMSSGRWYIVFSRGGHRVPGFAIVDTWAEAHRIVWDLITRAQSCSEGLA